MPVDVLNHVRLPDAVRVDQAASDKILIPHAPALPELNQNQPKQTQKNTQNEPKKTEMGLKAHRASHTARGASVTG